MTIKNSKIVMLTAYTQYVLHVSEGNTFSIPIFLQFVPTHFIIRLASYYILSSKAGNSAILLLKTSLYNGNPILSLPRVGIADSGNIHLDTKFKINPSVIGGNYDFELCDLWGLSPDFFNSMQIALTLEFIEEI